MLKHLLFIAALTAHPLLAQTPDAKASFTKTIAAGVNKWSFQDAKLTITRDGKPTTNSCSIVNATYPLTLKGDYPSVSLSIGDMKCDVDAREVTMLKSITWAMSYKAFHIPAGTTHPNQFRLIYDGKIPTYPRIDGKSVQSLNALINDNVVYMDMVATELDQLWKMDSVYYFAEISIEGSAPGQPAKLKMNLTINDVRKNTNTELTLLANLIPAK